MQIYTTSVPSMSTLEYWVKLMTGILKDIFYNFGKLKKYILKKSIKIFSNIIGVVF